MLSHAYDTEVAPAKPPGGLVVSLDFELAWGVLDVPGAEGPYKANLLGAREAIPRMLDLFTEFDVAATWATVGFLFAESGEELATYLPKTRPAYANPRFDPYREPVGASERQDPTRLAPSLIRMISQAPRQRIGSHTFSHYYCLEAGQTAEAFDADLASAVDIARARGIELRSLVFPRHQVRADYLPIVARHGLVTYRGNEPHWFDPPLPTPGGSIPLRLTRRLLAYIPLAGHHVLPWSVTVPRDGLVDVPASHFLRPYEPRLGLVEPLRLTRLRQALKVSAELGGLLHVWWHPHNMGTRMQENLSQLRVLLQDFARWRDETGFASYAMEDVAELALRPGGFVTAQV